MCTTLLYLLSIKILYKYLVIIEFDNWHSQLFLGCPDLQWRCRGAVWFEEQREAYLMEVTVFCLLPAHAEG